MIYTKGARVRACTSHTYCRGGQRERTGPINQAQPPRFCACARVCYRAAAGPDAPVQRGGIARRQGTLHDGFRPIPFDVRLQEIY